MVCSGRRSSPQAAPGRSKVEGFPPAPTRWVYIDGLTPDQPACQHVLSYEALEDEFAALVANVSSSTATASTAASTTLAAASAATPAAPLAAAAPAVNLTYVTGELRRHGDVRSGLGCAPRALASPQPHPQPDAQSTPPVLPAPLPPAHSRRWRAPASLSAASRALARPRVISAGARSRSRT